MRSLSSAHGDLVGGKHIVQILDHFSLQEPNGTHESIISECLGPSVADMVEDRLSEQRLPGSVAKSIIKSVIEGLQYMHNQNIVHGGELCLSSSRLI